MPGHVRLFWRIAAAVGLFTLVFAAVAQTPPAVPGGEGDRLQVLQCQVELALPTPPAEASQGGFHFAYESLGGTALDGRACTVYRIRNLQGSPPTPVRWSAGSEVLADVVGLPRCPQDEECEWIEVARYFDGDFLGGDTLLSYGLNADSFHEESPGLVAFASPDTEAAAASVGTEIVGTVVTQDGTEVSIDLVVRSRLERGQGGVVLIYEVTAEDAAQLDGSLFTLAWEAFDELAPHSLPTGDGASPFRTLTTGEPVAAQREGDTVSVRLTVESVVYEDPLSLVVMAAGSGEVLMRVPLPAFLPGG